MWSLSFPLRKTQVAVPSQIVEHEPQAFEFDGRQTGIIDIEYLAGTMRDLFALAQLARKIFRLTSAVTGSG